MEWWPLLWIIHAQGNWGLKILYNMFTSHIRVMFKSKLSTILWFVTRVRPWAWWHGRQYQKPYSLSLSVSVLFCGVWHTVLFSPDLMACEAFYKDGFRWPYASYFMEDAQPVALSPKPLLCWNAVGFCVTSKLHSRDQWHHEIACCSCHSTVDNSTLILGLQVVGRVQKNTDPMAVGRTYA